jgi:adenosylhomocysteine nucleosidase
VGQRAGRPADVRPAATDVAVICAMPMEVRPIVRKLSLHRTTIGGAPAYSGLLGDRSIVAVVTGMGTQLARGGTERLLDHVSVKRVVVVGITGALDNATPIGTLVRPEFVVNGATGAEYRPSPLGAAAPAGTMWTSDGLITDPDELARLRARGVVALDMETASVAAVCDERGIPWSVFRVISDRATDGSVNDEVFQLSHQDGTPDPRAIRRYFLRHPGSIPRMVKLANGARQAARAAADAAIRACSSGLAVE